MACKQFIRSLEAATGAEVISAPLEAGAEGLPLSDDSLLGTARNPLVNCPALAVMAANLAIYLSGYGENPVSLSTSTLTPYTPDLQWPWQKL